MAASPMYVVWSYLAYLFASILAPESELLSAVQGGTPAACGEKGTC